MSNKNLPCSISKLYQETEVSDSLKLWKKIEKDEQEYRENLILRAKQIIKDCSTSNYIIPLQQLSRETFLQQPSREKLLQEQSLLDKNSRETFLQQLSIEKLLQKQSLLDKNFRETFLQQPSREKLLQKLLPETSIHELAHQSESTAHQSTAHQSTTHQSESTAHQSTAHQSTTHQSESTAHQSTSTAHQSTSTAHQSESTSTAHQSELTISAFDYWNKLVENSIPQSSTSTTSTLNKISWHKDYVNKSNKKYMRVEWRELDESGKKTKKKRKCVRRCDEEIINEMWVNNASLEEVIHFIESSKK